MKLIQAGPLRVRVVEPRHHDEPSPSIGETRPAFGGSAIILCHGYGAPGDDLVSLADALDLDGVRFFFPEAPLSVDVGAIVPGRAWWPVDMERLQWELASGRGRSWDPDEEPAGLVPARTALAAALRVLVDEQGVDPARSVIGGFSQGAMITTDAVLGGDERLRFQNLAILSGSSIARARWSAALDERAPALHVFQSHGRGDPILPFGAAEALHQQLVRAGADATFVPFSGGHEIRPVVLDGLSQFVRARLGLQR